MSTCADSDLNNIIENERLNCNEYINSLISGQIIVQGNFVAADRFKLCKDAFQRLQSYLKCKIEQLTGKFN